MAEKQALLASETAATDLWNELQNARQRIKELELKLMQKDEEFNDLYSNLEQSNQKLSKCEADMSLLKSKQEKTYHDLRMQCQTAKHGQVKVSQLEKQIDILQKAETEGSARFLLGSRQSSQALASLTKVNEGLRSELSKSMSKWTLQIKKTQSKLDDSNLNLKALRNEASILRKTVVHCKNSKELAIAAVKEKILQKKSVHHLMHKGVFTEETRNVVRLLVKAGCSRNYINEVISAVLKSTGITTIGTISQPSISQVLHEGYFAAQIQLGHEMMNAESMTFSADGTSHRSVNYNARHVHLVADNYTVPLDGKPAHSTWQRVTRTFGIQSSRDGSSEEALADWEITLKKIIEVYNGSPLGKRSGGLLSFINLLIKLMGMNTNHCAKEKKDA